MSDALSEQLALGQSAVDAGQFADAVHAFTAARDLIPRDHPLAVPVALMLARAWQLAGNTVAARETLLTAHRQRPSKDPAVDYQLGAALLEVGAPREAAASFSRVSRARSSDPAPLAALAGARRAAGDPSSAWPIIEAAVAQMPENPAFLLTAAQVRHDLGDLDGAEAWLAQASAIRPNHGPTMVQRAYTSLLRGANASGWSDFESRPLPVPATGARAWNGESLHRASIAVTAEQGVGDQFQFARFIHHLHERGASRVIVECHADAVSLFAASGFEAVARGTSPSTDWHVPMMSLPHRLGLNDVVEADRVPYIRADVTARIDLPVRTNPAVRRLGIVWAGNPAFPGRVTRDLDGALLPSLLAAPHIEWISLQHGDTSAIDDRQLTRIPLSTDWSVTAHVLTQLDGLVTTDTGIAHLAGAMGVRTWVMLQHVPDWRWGLTGAHSVWYPTMTLVRQPSPGDWRSVVETLRSLLSDSAI